MATNKDVHSDYDEACGMIDDLVDVISHLDKTTSHRTEEEIELLVERAKGLFCPAKVENISLSTFSKGGKFTFTEDDVFEATQTDEYLIIGTPDWMMEDCNPVRIQIDNAFVDEVGGKGVIFEAFAEFVGVFDRRYKASLETKPPSLRDILKVDWRPFDGWDWEAFAGCNSNDPMIATIGDKYTLIFDYEGDKADISCYSTEAIAKGQMDVCRVWEFPLRPETI